MNKLVSIGKILYFRGPSYFWYIIHGHLVPRIVELFLHTWPRSRLRKFLLVAVLVALLSAFTILVMVVDAIAAALILGGAVLLLWLARKGWQRWRLWHLQKLAGESHNSIQATLGQELFTVLSDLALPTATGKALAEAQERTSTKELVIGHVDADGRLLSNFGDFPPLRTISEEEFAPRHRFPLDVVLVADKVLIRKDFRGDHKRFVAEWYNLCRLHGKANIPVVHHVVEADTLLYKNLIPGQTIRDVLVDAGARILNAQTNDEPELADLDHHSRVYEILARGTQLLADCFSEAFFLALKAEMNRIHAAGITDLSITFGNIIVDEQGKPWFIDFEGAHSHRSTKSCHFRFKRNRDRHKFNKIYDRSLLTKETARCLLAEQKEKLGGWYAPIDFGCGLTIGDFWTVESGTGRWEFLNEKIMSPLIAGKRVLDLGTNNGLMPMMMLCAGAQEVVGVEMAPEFVVVAKLVHQIFEWRDLTDYNFQIIQADMREIMHADWGKFDVITALCTLYYLSEDEMAQVVQRAAELAPIMIVQANAETRKEAPENKAYKSSVPFLNQVLKENGFPTVEVYAPYGYSRPLLVGST